MTENLPPCPKCSCAYTYEMNTLVVCPECAHEWSPADTAAEEAGNSGERVVRDSPSAMCCRTATAWSS
ncbi:hypothetical protein GCM10009601_61150 [Streptomyces thermospinosisporus]|uniref:Protein YjdM N-terminal domain-containing protein n=1 Tax=Streptomyces thermospinosisporus TaxID=161482 RepID=A0ABN1Z769_9ACTN